MYTFNCARFSMFNMPPAWMFKYFSGWQRGSVQVTAQASVWYTTYHNKPPKKRRSIRTMICAGSTPISASSAKVGIASWLFAHSHAFMLLANDRTHHQTAYKLRLNNASTSSCWVGSFLDKVGLFDKRLLCELWREIFRIGRWLSS